MPPYFQGLVAFKGFQGSSLEMLAIELAYFLIVVGICAFIYLKTREVYGISKHRGLFHFRNIFLYFAFAYVFRLVQVAYHLSNSALDLGLRRGIFYFDFLFVGYFSTMAILSLAMAALTRSMRTGVRKRDYLLHAIALAASVLALATRSNNALLFAQTIVLLGAIAIVFIVPHKEMPRRILSSNKITFLLLAVFWIVNLFAFSRRFLPKEAKIVLYALSAAVFISILLRVKKRLRSHAEEKQA